MLLRTSLGISHIVLESLDLRQSVKRLAELESEKVALDRFLRLAIYDFLEQVLKIIEEQNF